MGRSPSDPPPPSDRTRVRRMPQRGRYGRATNHAILHAAIVGHVRHVIDGQPFVTPIAVWRQEARHRIVSTPSRRRHGADLLSDHGHHR